MSREMMVKWVMTLGVVTMLALAGFTVTTYTETVGDLTWSYTLDKSNSATVTGVTPVPEELELPSALSDYPVVAVGASLFQGLNGPMKVVVPDSVTTIGAGAFAGSGIRKLALGESAFSGCAALKTVDLPENLRSIGSASTRRQRWTTTREDSSAVCPRRVSVT